LFSLRKLPFHVKLEAIASARRCWSSRLTGWWTSKEYSEKWKAEEERHKGAPDQKRGSKTFWPTFFHGKKYALNLA
jgi:hypothetical protein